MILIPIIINCIIIGILSNPRAHHHHRYHCHHHRHDSNQPQSTSALLEALPSVSGEDFHVVMIGGW